MSAEIWYPVTDDCPKVGVLVLVQWAGRQFRAARAPERSSGLILWTTFRDGEQVWLPPSREADRWGTEPDAWRPEHPEKWKAPLPEPITSISPRMWSSTTRFQAVEDATGEELAREMEHDREAARAGRAVEEASTDTASQWWRDATLITYSRPGSISKREAEGRLMRALARCGAGGEIAVSRMGYSALASMVGEVVNEPSTHIRLEWNGKDHDDFDVAMSWFTKLYPPEVRPKGEKLWSLNRVQKILCWRAKSRPLSFALIGENLGISASRASALYTGTAKQIGAIDRICKIANGQDE